MRLISSVTQVEEGGRLCQDRPAAARRLCRDRPAAAQRLCRDRPAEAQRLCRDRPAEAQRLCRDRPEATQHLSLARWRALCQGLIRRARATSFVPRCLSAQSWACWLTLRSLPPVSTQRLEIHRRRHRCRATIPLHSNGLFQSRAMRTDQVQPTGTTGLQTTMSPFQGAPWQTTVWAGP